MSKEGRYQTSAHEDFEPGSKESVLKNKLTIKDSLEMEDRESLAYQRSIDACIERFNESDILSLEDILWIHHEWLGEIYSFAGRYRTVNMSKGDVIFAAAHLIPKLMIEFEEKFLKKYTPGSKFLTLDDLVHALAVIHVEFILIHPFREGNGRVGRLLCTLIALQAGKNMLDFSYIAQVEGREEYFRAIQAGWDKEYSLMESLFKMMIITSEKDA